MKIKRSQLNELVRVITRQILKEYTTMATDSTDDKPSSDGDTKDGGTDAVKSALEKEKERREKKKEVGDQIKLKTKELDAQSDELKYHKQRTDQLNRFNLPNVRKELSSLKHEKI